MAKFKAGVFEFKNAQDCDSQLREGLYLSPTLGKVLRDKDNQLLLTLIEGREWPEDEGKTQSHLEIGLDPFGKRNYRMVWTDGSHTEFSFVKARKNYDPLGIVPDNPNRYLLPKVKAAFRNAIHDQVLAVKLEAKGKHCPNCQRPMKFEFTDVDHAKGDHGEFKDLLELFLTNESLTMDKVSINDTKNTIVNLGDSTMAARWTQFHLVNANLIALCRDCHMTKDGHKVKAKVVPEMKPVEEDLTLLLDDLFV